MGSTSVSEVTGIMSVGQGSQTLTGTKEGDLKVQFAEVMSQMTTQVGYGYSYGGQNGKQNMSVVTGKSSVTDNYERYQNNAASIKNNPSDKTDIQTGNTDEKLATFEEDVRQVLKEKLGVTDEEITDAMQKLGLTVADLIQPNQLTQLTAELTGSENIGELLCNDSFMEIVNEIGGLSQDLLDDLGMTSQMFTETVAAASQVVTTPESAGIEQLPEMQVTENVNADKTAANDNQMNSVLKEEKTVQTASDADEVEIQKQEDNIILQKEVAEETDNTDDMQEKTTLSEDNSLMQEETDTKADDGQTGNRNESGNTSNQTAFVSQEHTVDPAAAKTPETVPEFSRQLDTLDLIRQVTEFTKVTVREAQTTMEMQLNPEHLGKLYIEVTTKEGNVSAHIMTQNELVKEALESQMAELKQSMNQAGVKVDAVEVTVGSHEFEKNLEQNAKQDERQAEEQEKASPKTRRINLDELDELSGVMSEEEALVAQIMADHGNSVDYTA
ncbi:flagellar hook-length control protein FliK [Roseburia sp.]|uniref:flagellar hook-length control protein FliK n=1 Tax=Roseburia sp. TaxID=2049040 RepID=UPI00352281F1